MINLVPLIDALGEPGAALAGALVLGLVFGFCAQRSGFCTRSALLAVLRRTSMTPAAIWALGFAVAIFGVQALIAGGFIDVSDTRFFGTAQSLTGAVIGGLPFGAGMVLARGCVSRHMVLAASGNLRAVVTSLVIAAVGYATYDGMLVPARNAIAGLLNTSAIGGNSLLAQASLPAAAGVVLGALLLVGAAWLALRTRVSIWQALGGLAVGCTIPAGWYFTYALSTQVFEPIQAESLSFIRPLATTAQIVIGDRGAAGFDQGVMVGTLIGASIAALAFRAFRIEGFGAPGSAPTWRYLVGGALMGFGGILAVGCTIGAGFTGGSVLAISSLLALAAMILGAVATDRLLIHAPKGVPARAESPTPMPSE